jgi:hypothetical protein
MSRLQEHGVFYLEAGSVNGEKLVGLYRQVAKRVFTYIHGIGKKDGRIWSRLICT